MKVLMNKGKVALGILLNRPISGPMEVAIDITNNCTMKCITCWNYSPFIKSPPSHAWRNEHVTIEKFKELADFFGKAGVTKIMVGADGDPFLHPQIVEILEVAKSTGAQVSVATKGAYFNHSSLTKLAKMKLDTLNISILAASEEVFKTIHPQKDPKLFAKIINHTKFLCSLKKESEKQRPNIGFVFVVCKYNYHEVDRIMDLAHELGADYVAYKRISVIPETKHLLLKQTDIEILNEKLKLVEQKSQEYGIEASVDEFRRTTVAGLVNGRYSDALYKKIPCYVGWSYARILVNGDVAPCCGCVSKVLGNIYKDRFEEIWRGDDYAEFRKMSKRITHSNEKISGCSCGSCVHSYSNFGIFRKLNPIKARKIFSS